MRVMERSLVEQIMSEGPLTFTELGRKLGVNRNTVRDWHKIGRVSRITDKCVFLEAIQSTTGMRTSEAAYLRFVEQLNDPGLE